MRGSFPCTVEPIPVRTSVPEVLVIPPLSPAVTLAPAVRLKAPRFSVATSSTVTPITCTLEASRGSSGADTGTYTESSVIGTALGYQFSAVFQSVVPALAVQVRVTPATGMVRVPASRLPTADISDEP